MVGRPGKYQPRFTAGELDPLIQANTDETVYFKGASRFLNVKPLPQGGFSNRWGTFELGQAHGMLGPVPMFSASAPNGGAANNILDGDPATYLTTNTLSGLAAVAIVDLGIPRTFSFVDLEAFAANLPSGAFPTISAPSPPLSPPIGGTVAVAGSLDNATYLPIDGPVALSDTLRTRRFGSPANAPRRFRFIKITVAPTTSLVFNLANVRVFAQTGAVSPVRIRSFTHSRAVAHDIVFTDQNAEVYGVNGRVASISLSLSATALAGSMVAAMKNAQQLDTMLLFHQALQPLRIMRQGSDAEWNSEPAPLTNLPNFDFGAGYSNGVAAQWQLSFFNFDSATGSIPLPSGGAHFTITVNGAVSPAIQQPPNDYTGTAAAIQAAILALPGVGPGATVALTSIGTEVGGVTTPPPVFTITFGGASNAGNGWAVAGTSVDKADAAITAANTVAGILGGEPVISPSRGWPGCGCFYQQRLVMGGLAGVPNAALASQTGDYYEFNTKLTGAEAPMLIPLDTDGAATIVQIHSGRTLDFFCDSGEYWLATGALDATTTPTIVRGTTNGIAPTVDAFENEGKTYYAGREGGSLFEFVFNYSEQNYDSLNISVVSSSLVKGVIDGAMRRIAAATDLNELYCVRDDGLAFLLNLLREQEITSYARLETDGLFLAANVNDRFEVTFAVQRQVNGAAVVFVERMAEGLFLDQQGSFAVAAGDAAISGLAEYIGAEIWATVDGLTQGPFVVPASGTIALGFPAVANGVALVGRWTPPVVATLPQPRDVAPRTVVRRPCRVHTVRASVVATSNVAIGANGDGPYEVALQTFGLEADQAPNFTGPVAMEGLQGFTEDGIVVFTQVRPGPLTVTGVTVEVDL